MRGLKRLAVFLILLEKFLTFLEPQIPVLIALKHFLGNFNQQIIKRALTFESDFCVLSNITSECFFPINCR
jgi:hypothetical protein